MIKKKREAIKFIKENEGKLLSEYHISIGTIRNYNIKDEIYHEFEPENNMKYLYYFIKVS